MNRFVLKLLLATFMVFDHAYMFLPLSVGNYAHIITRFVSVGFAYLAVEGFLHTRDLRKYIGRMYLFAGIMQTGNMILNHFLRLRGVEVTNNIFLTLALGLSLLAAIKYLKKLPMKIAACAVIAALSFFAEGGYIVVPFMVLTYLFREKKTLQYLSYIILSALLYLLLFGFHAPEFLLMNCDFMFITVIPLLLLYNHEEGLRTTASKYFFYIFYPLHLWLIALIQFCAA